jgi:hypothetical protein
VSDRENVARSANDVARNEKAVDQASKLFGNPGGSPGDAGNIDTALGAVFTPAEGAARGDRNHEQARGIQGVRAALGKEMLALGFSDNSAKEFSALLGEYHSNPRDTKEQREANLDKALEDLSTEWGDTFHARLAGAEKILATLTKGNPALLGFVHSTGLSSDVRLLRMAGEIAKHQPVAQAEKRGQAQAAAGQRSSSDRRRSPSKLANALYGGKKR